MKIPKYYFLFICALFVITVHAQNKNSIWVFGDNAGIDFAFPSNPTPIASHVISRGTCTNICNSVGQLLFYAAPDTDVFSTGSILNGEINRPDGSIMPNGDSLVGLGWYYEMVIVPFSDDTNKYYVFAIGITTSYGLWYHVVDMSQDSGKGVIIQKNIQLLNFSMIDGLSAIKHGNGRDWWVICRRAGTPSVPNNEWYSYLITPSGLTNNGLQYAGNLNSTNNGVFSFNSEGNKICFVNAISMIELYDFDRCTGIISNTNNIEPEVTMLPYPFYWSCAFSPTGQYLYVSGSTTPSTLWQFDTWAPNIAASKTLIWQVSYPPYTAGALKLAPDNKIYMSCAWSDSIGNWNYPYPDSAHYLENENLGVINSPDSPGLACNFQPWSFYLGGKRTYWGLPNNPDYELGPLAGSICDTLTSSVQEITEQNQMNIFPNPFFNKITFQYGQHNKLKIKGVSVFNIMGECVLQKKITQPFYELDLSFLPKGVYFISITTEKNIFTKKIVKI